MSKPSPKTANQALKDCSCQNSVYHLNKGKQEKKERKIMSSVSGLLVDENACCNHLITAYLSM